MRKKYVANQVAIQLCTGAGAVEVAEAHGLSLEDAQALIASPAVVKAEKQMQTLHRLGPSAARGVLLDAFPEVIECILAVATDIDHKKWDFAVKAYLDRVMPAATEVHSVHIHEGDAESKEAALAASGALVELAEWLKPVREALAKQTDIRNSRHVLRGEDAKPSPLVLDVKASDE